MLDGLQPTRVHPLNDAPARRGAYVLYWMQQSQRADFNHALEYALHRANERGEPLLVAFGLMDGYPEANLRHYRFMLEGLADTRAALAEREIGLVVRHGHPAQVARELGAEASVVVCDRGYLRHQRAWRAEVARLDREVVEVESDLVVPVEVASDKREYAARTIRPRIHRQLEDYLVPLPPARPRRPSLDLSGGLDLSDPGAVLDRLDLDRSVPPVHRLYRGGPTEARARLERLVGEILPGYDAHRNQPQTNYTSFLGMYLHFGQISPIEVALAVLEADDIPATDRDAFVEELIVRRELAFNYAWYEPGYDSYQALPQWARTTLSEHADDPRDPAYTLEQLAAADTHDPWWNAAMRELSHTGYMHNYMRMYWGKKILEWSETPEQAFANALYLNNRFFLDGRDPNSYTGVAWCFGLHDRAWSERPIFGKVRYMSAGGLQRKADPAAYVEKVDALVAEATGWSST